MSSRSLQKPTGWPADVEYLRSQKYSKKLPKEVQAALTVQPNDAETIKDSAGPCTHVRIRSIENVNHPAKGQSGLFASRQLPPDTLILCYLGYVHDEAESDSTSNYDLSLDREMGVGVDATHHGNEARFVNDYRGIATAPNAEFRDVLVEMGGGKVEKRIAVFVLTAGKSGKRAKGIGKGEEILVSYGKGFWNERKVEG